VSLFLKSQKVGPLPPVSNPYPSRFQQLRRRLNRYGAIGVVFLLLCSLFFSQWRDTFLRSSLDGITHLVAIAQTPLEFLSDTFHNAKSMSTLNVELRQLEDEVRMLKRELIQYNQLKFENDVLKRYLNVPEREGIKFFTAPVIAIPKGSIKQTILIGIGVADGVEEGQGVISNSGVVGRLVTVGQISSRVRLLTDYESRIPVYLPRIQKRAILAGDGSAYPYLVYITDTTDLIEGEDILTSGLGGVFPQGIPIGKIKKIDGGMITVQPQANAKDSYFVQVLKTIKNESKIRKATRSE
jgi:rod shape-determining protein MreC